MKDYLELAKEAAIKAGEYIASRYEKDFAIEKKGEINLVTEVDKKSEEMIVAMIQERYPDHDILAEEESGSRQESNYRWIIDPLDGTTNFSHGYPLFVVVIALEIQGEVAVGVVYDPLRKELFSAIKGEGAFLNDEKISVSSIQNLNEALVVTGFAYDVRETKDNLKEFTTMIMHAQGVRRDGVAAADLCYVACGRYEAYWEKGLYPWDVAAGALILNEAGGKVTRYANDPFTVYDREILASNSLVHGDVSRVLTELSEQA